MPRVQLSQVRPGSKIMVRGGFGADAPRHAIVLDVEADGKNGQPTIGYIGYNDRDHSNARWAYLDQIVSVEKY